jgi:ferredoxin
LTYVENISFQISSGILDVARRQSPFSSFGHDRPGSGRATILDAADEVRVFIDCACRSGTCASCRVKLLSGNVSMVVQDALTHQDKAEGYILACQAKVHGEVTIDA